MTKKIIYVSLVKLTDKIARDWFIDYSIEKGVEVEYWDIVALLREEHYEYGSLHTKYLRKINSYKEFEALVCQPENEDAVYVMLVSYSGRFSRPFRLLSKYKCKMVYISWGLMPTTISDIRIKRVAHKFFSNPIKFCSVAFDHFFGIALRKLKLVNQFEIVFTAGSTLGCLDQFSKNKVAINLCDYDHYQSASEIKQGLVQGNYVVFLDVNLPHQSDLVIAGLPSLDAKNYYKALNRFFGLIEKAYNTKVVIAAHPKASYTTNGPFQGRDVYRLVTAELVKDAQFVISHTSTSISYAVLNAKPIVFIYTDEMEKVYEKTEMRELKNLAGYFKVPIYNVNRVVDGREVKIKIHDPKCYYSYKYNFLTTLDSENSVSARIFLHEMMRL